MALSRFKRKERQAKHRRPFSEKQKGKNATWPRWGGKKGSIPRGKKGGKRPSCKSPRSERTVLPKKKGKEKKKEKTGTGRRGKRLANKLDRFPGPEKKVQSERGGEGERTAASKAIENKPERVRPITRGRVESLRAPSARETIPASKGGDGSGKSIHRPAKRKVGGGRKSPAREKGERELREAERCCGLRKRKRKKSLTQSTRRSTKEDTFDLEKADNLTPERVFSPSRTGKALAGLLLSLL